mgnify:CR=1 FL=1
MDDVMIRSRYPRHGVQNRKRKKYPRGIRNTRIGITTVEKIARQLLAATCIFLVIIVVKNIDTPVTNYLTDKIKGVLLWNVEIKSIYEGIDSTLSKFVKSGANKNENGAFDERAVTANGNAYSPVKGNDMVNQDYYQTEEFNENQSEDNLKIPAEGPTTQVSSISTGQDTQVSSRFIAPVTGVAGSLFGERTDPITGNQKVHKGIDIEAEKGASIKAALAGDVTESGADASYGNYIKIRHPDGFTTVYAHCSKLIAKKGQKVEQGDIIARVGDTGASVGAHLHFEIWKDGKPVNPLNYIKVPSK